MSWGTDLWQCSWILKQASDGSLPNMYIFSEIFSHAFGNQLYQRLEHWMSFKLEWILTLFGLFAQIRVRVNRFSHRFDWLSNQLKCDLAIISVTIGHNLEDMWLQIKSNQLVLKWVTKNKTSFIGITFWRRFWSNTEWCFRSFINTNNSCVVVKNSTELLRQINQFAERLALHCKHRLNASFSSRHVSKGKRVFGYFNLD